MRTKDFSNSCFYNALVELLKTKSFNDIQIQEICIKAGYNRSTFYRSYKSKVDILLNEFKKGLNKYIELVNKSQDFSFINKTKLLFDLLKESSTLMLLTHKAGLDNEIYDLFYEIYPIDKEYENKLGKYYKPFRTAGMFKIIMEWLTSGMKESSLEMANIVAIIMNNCNAKY
jgi:AcrR family transcriptional regulator